MCSRDIKEGDIIEEHNYGTSQNKVGVMVVTVTNRSQDGVGGVLPLLLSLSFCRSRNFLVLLDFSLKPGSFPSHIDDY